MTGSGRTIVLVVAVAAAGVIGTLIVARLTRYQAGALSVGQHNGRLQDGSRFGPGPVVFPPVSASQ